MFHACLVSTLLCFVYTLRYFYTFSGTNLLTRCHSASCLFSVVFVPEKPENEYSRNSTGKKPKSTFHRGEHRDGRRDEGGPRGSHAPWPRGQAWPMPRGCGRLRHPLGLPLRL